MTDYTYVAQCGCSVTFYGKDGYKTYGITTVDPCEVHVNGLHARAGQLALIEKGKEHLTDLLKVQNAAEEGFKSR